MHLRRMCTFFSLFITIHINGLSVTISPIPASVIAGDDLIVTSKITKTTSESWKTFVFYVSNGNGDGDGFSACRGAFYSTSAACTDVFGCSRGFDFTCNYTHFNLLINDVNLSLLGLSIYAEVTYGSSSKEKSENTTIQVIIPLQEVLLTPNGTITKIESDTQVFRCFARSLPIASLRWRLNESFLPTSSQPVATTDTVTSTYTYTAQQGDNGKRLSCIAVYVSTSFSEDALINVLYRPVVTVSPTNYRYRVLENTTDLQLTCNVMDANPSVTSFTWYKDGSTISGVASTYTVPTVHRSHAGSYTCGATNSVGSSDPSAVIQLEVLYGPGLNIITKKEPFEGTKLLITCSGQSYPALTDNDVTWTKQNNITFLMKGKQLVIPIVNRIDSGTFVCFVVITLLPTIGQPLNVTGRTTVKVDVLYRPTVTMSPKNAQYNVIENTTNLKLDCTLANANPVVTSYRWYKDGSLIDGSTDASYTLSTVLRSHTGRYTCDATNTVGSSDPSSAVQLNVLYGVELYPINKNLQTEGNQLTITCSGQSYPVLTSSDVKWLKHNNNTFSRVGQQLVIDNVNRLDSGTYICSAVIQLTPSVGPPVNVTGSTTVEIDVLYRPDVAVSPDINPYHVKENTSNLLLICNVTDANPVVTSYRWYKDGVKVSTAVTYIISTVYRSHKGSYTCDATNTVGSSDSSSVVELDVLYGVSLKLSGTEISINESDRWELSCIGDGNPLPKITCVYEYNRTTVGEQKNNVTSISVDHANCVDTGLYMCTGKNKIGVPVSLSADIKVACKPRTYSNLNNGDIFISGLDESLNLSTKFISYPLSQISWSRELPDGNLTDIDNEFIASTIQSQLPYETISILKKHWLKPSEFGIYVLKASNIHGSFLLKYNVIRKKAPIPPSFVYAVCKSTTAVVIWKPVINEYIPYDLQIQYGEIGQTVTSKKVHQKETDQPAVYTVTGLNQGRTYNFSILAVNLFGESRSHHVDCLTEALCSKQDVCALKEGEKVMFNAGISTVVVGFILLTAATILVLRERFKKKNIKSSESDEYADLQASNPTFTDPYNTLHDESRTLQEPSANTYEDCGTTTDAPAYQNIEKNNSVHKKAEKNIYNNMKI